MTPEELSAIEARANAATPGPWLVEHWDDRGRIYASSGDDTIAENGGFGTWDDVDGPNAYFIACSRADIPALLAEVRRSGICEPCTCGSGGHPRECKRHPDRIKLHAAELDEISLEEDLAAAEAEVRRLNEVVELLQRRMSEQCVYSAGLKSGADARLQRSEALLRDLVSVVRNPTHTRDEVLEYIDRMNTLRDAYAQTEPPEPRYSTEAVDELLSIINFAVCGTFGETKRLDEAVAAVRASREPKL